MIIGADKLKRATASITIQIGFEIGIWRPTIQREQDFQTVLIENTILTFVKYFNLNFKIELAFPAIVN